jgi:hypothetical protein
MTCRLNDKQSKAMLDGEDIFRDLNICMRALRLAEDHAEDDPGIRCYLMDLMEAHVVAAGLHWAEMRSVMAGNEYRPVPLVGSYKDVLRTRSDQQDRKMRRAARQHMARVDALHDADALASAADRLASKEVAS